MRTPRGEATATGPPGVVGRGAELTRLDAVLARAGSGTPAVAVIRGDIGCGKTHLLDALAGRSQEAGWRCLRVQGVESEAVLSGAGLLTLLTPLRGALGSIPRVQAVALAAALGWSPAGAPGGRFLVGAATLSLLSAEASVQPLLVAVDDVQWLDTESGDALLFAARRLGHDRVAVVMTHRAGAPLRLPLEGFETITVEGLSPDDARTLLGAGYTSEVVGRLVAETGGNPLALRECDRMLGRAQRVGAAPLPQVLPVPERLRDVYVGEVASLPPAARQAVVLCAANSGTEAAPVLAALASEGLDPLGCLIQSGDVLVEEGGTLTFRHPLLRAATWAQASVVERHAAHRLLATVITDRAARAWHLAEATPGHDAALADELAEVADVERPRRGFGASARALERSARLTADPRLRLERLAAATEDAYVAGDSERTRRLAAAVLAGEAGADPRARVLLTLGMLEWSHGAMARARELLEQAAGLAVGAPLVWTLRELFHTCHLLDDTAGMVAAADKAASVADRDDPEQAMLTAYLSGAAHVVEGRPDLGAPLVHHAVELLETQPVLRDDPRHLLVSLLCARWLMDPFVAMGYAERRVRHAREVGALGVLSTGLPLLATGLAWMGDHVRAYAYAGEAVELLEALGITADPGIAYETAATECACRGMHQEARWHLERAKASVARNGFDPMPPHLAHVVALCALCRGDLTEVVDVLEDQVRRFDGVGTYLEPLGVAPMLVEAYTGLGRDDDARQLAVRFRSAQSDPPYPQVAALVARCEAMVAADLDEASASFERSLALQAGLPDRLEAARTQLLYGMRLRRGGRRVDARAHLEAARRQFVGMELTLWAEMAARELAGTGERVQARDASSEPLTSQETRVAVLVAQGLKNREVAAALFLSPKTVEHHLGSVLRKRGLRSRTELARALAADGGGEVS